MHRARVGGMTPAAGSIPEPSARSQDGLRLNRFQRLGLQCGNLARGDLRLDGGAALAGAPTVCVRTSRRGLTRLPACAYDRLIIAKDGSTVMTAPSRIDARFAALKAEGRSGLVTFVTAGDPDPRTSADILAGLPAAGADVIELGMPFSDPMADGPAIQASSQRALAAGMTLSRTLAMVKAFRRGDQTTPVVLMGYYNPIYVYPVDAFLDAATDAGVDGLIVVDVPPEADAELCLPAAERGLAFIRLATPTTDAKRLPTVLANASGFVYYVSITGITGAAAPVVSDVQSQVARIKARTDLPVAVGFGVRTPGQVREMAGIADAVVVGSALITILRDSLDANGKARDGTVSAVLDLVKTLSGALRPA